MGFVAIIKIFFAATVTFAVAMILTPFWLRFLRAKKFGKQIREEASAPTFFSLHKNKSGTPTAGGVLIWGSVLLVIGFFYEASALFGGKFFTAFSFFSRRETLLPLGVLVASAIVGFIDDYYNVRKIGPKGGGLRMRHRLGLYTAIALVGALWFYFKLDWDVFHIPFVGTFALGPCYIPLFVFVIVATSFSVNETDGLDGLAGGVLLTSFGAYAAIAFHQGKVDLATFCAAIVGALLAFLWFNIHPAKFFMGDTGAMSLGVTLGVVAMLTNEALLLPIIGIVFVIESGSVILQVASKRLRKKKIFLSTPLHHHLEATGMAEPTIVMRLWIISTVTAVIGMIVAVVDLAFK